MKNRTTYHEQKEQQNLLKLRTVLNDLPDYVNDYFRSISPTTSVKTQLSYVYDVRVFLHYLQKTNPYFKKYASLKEIRLQDLDLLKAVDIEEYLEYLKYYTDDAGKLHTNGERGLMRKLASLRSFFLYFFKRELLHNNPTLVVDMPKLHEKEIIRFEANEIAEFLDYVEHGGEALTGQKRAYFEKNKLRNLAICTLLLGTGIRISECVGLDLEDVDLEERKIKITRKGGKEDFIYLGTEVTEAMSDYVIQRNQIHPIKGHEHALFLSTQRRRISVQAVENMVTGNAKHVTTLKHITPHKLRSSFGTNLYRETGDIYLVAKVLGHNDVNTTRKHYAAMDEDKKRKAADVLRLREK